MIDGLDASDDRLRLAVARAVRRYDDDDAAVRDDAALGLELRRACGFERGERAAAE